MRGTDRHGRPYPIDLLFEIQLQRVRRTLARHEAHVRDRLVKECPAALDVEVHGSSGGCSSTQVAIEARVPDRNPLAW